MFEEIFGHGDRYYDEDLDWLEFRDCYLRMELHMMVIRKDPVVLRTFKSGHTFQRVVLDVIDGELRFYETYNDFDKDDCTLRIPLTVSLKPNWDVRIGEKVVKDIQINADLS